MPVSKAEAEYLLVISVHVIAGVSGARPSERMGQHCILLSGQVSEQLTDADDHMDVRTKKARTR